MRKTRLPWDMPVQTDRKISNRPDIMKHKTKKKECILIDMAIPFDRNTSIKVTENLSKYKDLEVKSNRIWGWGKDWNNTNDYWSFVTCKEELEKHTTQIPGTLNIHKVQKTALLETAHTLQRCFQSSRKKWRPSRTSRLLFGSDSLGQKE